MAITPVQWGFFSFLIGVFCADFFREYSGLYLSVLFFLPSFLPGLLSIGKKLIYSIWGVLGFIIGFFFLWFHIPDIPSNPLYPLASTEQNIVAAGIIISYPLQRENKTQFEMEVRSIQNDPHNTIGIPENNTQKILVSQFGIHDWKYGESVLVKGKILLPKPFNGFLYDRFLAKDEIYSIMPSAYVAQSSEHYTLSAWQQFWVSIFPIREYFEKNIRSTIAFPESEYALGIILGADSGIPQKILDDFTASGLRHLLALSGFNITIILLVIFSLFAFFPIWLRISISLLFIALFVGITGASASVVRAAVMGGVGMILLYSGRKQNPLWIVLFSVVCIILYNPFLLFSDPSLHLSVLAVLGLILYLPLVKKYGKNIFNTMPKIVSEVMMATIAAQIFTIPYIAYSFGTFSWVSFLANLFVVPITAFAMLFSFLCALPFIGILCMPFAYILLHFSIFIANIFARLPYAQIGIIDFSAWHLIWIYTIIIWIAVRYK